jgi:putative endonuclease
MNKDDRQETGSAGEETALAHLQSQGLQLVLRNYRCRGGEIDLVMLDRKVLVFVEVRYRSHESFGGAAASVDARKQQRIVLAARHLLMKRRELTRHPARFDVVAIAPLAHGQNRGNKIDWIRDAFRIT